MNILIILALLATSIFSSFAWADQDEEFNLTITPVNFWCTPGRLNTFVKYREAGFSFESPRFKTIYFIHNDEIRGGSCQPLYYLSNGNPVDAQVKKSIYDKYELSGTDCLKHRYEEVTINLKEIFFFGGPSEYWQEKVDPGLCSNN